MINFNGKQVQILAGYKDMTETAKYTARQTAGGVDIVDDTLAYVKKIQGDTVKSKNIFNRYYGTRQPVGATASKITDESITIKQTVGGTYKFYAFPIENPEQYVGKTLYISAKWTNSSANKGSVRICWYKNGTWSWNTAHGYTSGEVVSGVVPTKPDGASGLYVMLYANTEGTGVADNTVTYTDIMVSTENIAYIPYFAGLKHAYIDSIKSASRNIFTFEKARVDDWGSTGEVLTNYSFKCTQSAISTSYFSANMWLKAGTYTISFLFSAVDTSQGTTTNGFYVGYAKSSTSSSPAGSWIKYTNYGKDQEKRKRSMTFTTTKDDYILFNWYLCIQSPSTITNHTITVEDIQLERGETANEFTPYKEDIYQLSEPVELPKWDYIDVENKKIVRATKPAFVIDGVNKKLQSADTYATNFWLMDYRTGGDTKDLAGVIADNFTSRTISSTTTNNEGVYIANNGKSVYFWVRKSAYPEITDTASANAYFAEHPCVVTYHMSTATEEDIDIPDDGYLTWNKGNETIEQGATDNSIYGAELTVTTDYNIATGVSVFEAKIPYGGKYE